jgi:hypothetical protein
MCHGDHVVDTGAQQRHAQRVDPRNEQTSYTGKPFACDQPSA